MRKFSFSTLEIKEILISAVALSVAFAISFAGGIMQVEVSSFLPLVIFSFIAVGIGFLAHEIIGHKFVAQHYSLFAEYRMWKLGIGFALLSSLFGFVFAAPGAVMISQSINLWGSPVPVTKKKMGMIAAMGPAVNLAIGGVFFALNYFNPSQLFSIAMQVNIWLALFNMIPIPPLDGSKILAWDKRVWIAFFALLAAVFILTTRI